MGPRRLVVWGGICLTFALLNGLFAVSRLLDGDFSHAAWSGVSCLLGFAAPVLVAWVRARDRSRHERSSVR